MSKLFLLDTMALVYRAHFALISRPIFTSKGVNSSALFGFTQTLLQIIHEQQPTHVAAAFDTDAPTHRHREYAEYKSQREAMPEDLRAALPSVRRLLDAFRIPILECDGCEADDLIGTLVQAAEREGFTTYMVSPDKDFGQLVTARTFIYKPSRMGDGIEILGEKEVLERWGIHHPRQVTDILGLMGDASDNIPGVPGIGEKTASKLIGQYGSIEELLARSGELKGKLLETLTQHRQEALLSKRLATIHCDAPIPLALEALRLRERDDPALRALCQEFEFNSIGKRLFGDDFRAGRSAPTPRILETEEMDFSEKKSAADGPPPVEAPLPKKLSEIPHSYRMIESMEQFRGLLSEWRGAGGLALAIEWTANPSPATGEVPAEGMPALGSASLSGLAFSTQPNAGWFLAVRPAERAEVLALLGRLLAEHPGEIIGHDLKRMLGILRESGLVCRAALFDTALAHSLLEPDLRHNLSSVAESLLGRTPFTRPPESPELALRSIVERAPSTFESTVESVVEQADLALQLRAVLAPRLREKKQEHVFREIEARLIPALIEMEFEGIRVDAKALEDFGAELARQMVVLEAKIQELAGVPFNLNSPKQLGEILFERLKLVEKAKKTKTGQYATNEQTLQELAGEHEIVRKILDYRVCTKLKSTYVDTLPNAIDPRTGRIHTTFRQNDTATGRLASDNPNLQNIPIRTELGREIRKAFVPRDDQHLLLSADYSQIELRIIAALGQETALIEAFRQNLDIHTATAARVFGVFHELVTPEMRRKAKMVNYGIAYGISAFGLAQRLGIPRREAAQIIDHYFAQFPGVRRYMTDTIEFCREQGYVQTFSGRRRYLRDIRSSNATIRGAAERNAINAPIQGTAADMIKIAMGQIHQALLGRGLRSRMLLQVHDELVFDLLKTEESEVKALVEEKMRTALDLGVPIVVEMGTGHHWLEAH